MKIFDFLSLVWEDYSLPSVFSDRGLLPIFDQREEASELVSYIDIIAEFHKQFSGASLNDRGVYTIIVQGAPVIFLVDKLIEFLSIPSPRDAYPNMLPRESNPPSDLETTKDE